MTVNTTVQTPAGTPPTTPASTSNGGVAIDRKDYNAVLGTLSQLINQWEPEKQETIVRRKVRDLDIDVSALRDAGELQEDETFIPIRTIQTNIAREKPPFISYLTQSQRIAIFTSVLNPQEDNRDLDLRFTRGMTYKGWQIPFLRCLDGTQTHGWDSIEVVFDQTKPYNVGIEHIGHDRLIFARDTLDIQNNEEVLREYSFTPAQLQANVAKFGFDAAQVKFVLDSRSQKGQTDTTITVYKRFFKIDGIVWSSWFSKDAGCTAWLKAPVMHTLGIKHKEQVTVEVEQTVVNPLDGSVNVVKVPTQQEQWKDTPQTMYPIFIQYYDESEKPRIEEHYGRVYLDEFKQEAQSAIASGYVNQTVRSSKIYGSPKQANGTGSNIKALETKLSDGTLLDQPFEFWNTPSPNDGVLRGLQYFDVQNTQETGQLNFAANNRTDSRKTAAEVNAAENQYGMLTSVNVTLFSIFLRDVFNFVWPVVRSLANQGIIIVLPKVDTSVPQVAGIEPLITNDLVRINKEYDIRPAGDIDFVQRNQQMQMMQQMWPIIAATPLAPMFLATMVRLAFPEKGEMWAGVLEQAPTQIQQLGQQLQQADGLLNQLFHLMTSAIKDGAGSKMNGAEQSSIQQVMMATAQFLQQQKQMAAAQQQGAK